MSYVLLRNIAFGLRSLFRSKQVDRELNEELGTYLDIAASEKFQQGMSRRIHQERRSSVRGQEVRPNLCAELEDLFLCSGEEFAAGRCTRRVPRLSEFMRFRCLAGSQNQ